MNWGYAIISKIFLSQYFSCAQFLLANALFKEMKMKKTLLTAAVTSLLVSGCSRDYTPAPGASGEDIFKAACMECHEAIEGKDNIYYELTSDKRTTEFVAEKLASGSLKMPKFPNITGDSLKAISQFVVDHSVEKVVEK